MSSPDDEARIRAALEEAHGREPPPGFARTWAAALAQARQGGARGRRRLALVAVPVLAAALAVCSTLFNPRPITPAPLSPAELSRLGELSGPLDFLLTPPADETLSSVPRFDLSPPSQEPIELTKGLAP